MIHAHRPQRFQAVYIVDPTDKVINQQTTTLNGCMLLFFSEARMLRLREAVDSEMIPMESFIAQALETYCSSIEQSFANPQFPKVSRPAAEEN